MLREESNTTPRLRTLDEGILVVSPTVMRKSFSVDNFCFVPNTTTSVLWSFSF